MLTADCEQCTALGHMCTECRMAGKGAPSIFMDDTTDYDPTPGGTIAAQRAALDDDTDAQHAALVAGSAFGTQAAGEWTQFADHLTDEITRLAGFLPPLPDSEEWWEKYRPELPVETEPLYRRLRLCVRDAYAIAGTYRKAVNDLDQVIRNLDTA